MATAPIVYADGFMDYATADLGKWWTSSTSGTINNSGGRGGRGSLTIANSSQSITLASHSLWVVNCGFYLTTPTTNDRPFLFGSGGSGDVHATFNTDRTLAFTALNVAVGSTSKAIPTGTWIHTSVRVYFHSSAGTIDVWFNETNVLSLTGLNTGAARTQFTFLSAVGGTWAVSDLVIQQSDTSTDQPIGDRAVQTLFVNGGGNYSQLTRLSGPSNYLMVDETNEDGDTTYNYSASSNSRDTYAMQDLAASVATVNGVMAAYVAKKTDAGSRSFAPVFRISGVDYSGAPQSLGTDYGAFYQIWEKSPATGSAWTPSEVNGTEAGAVVT